MKSSASRPVSFPLQDAFMATAKARGMASNATRNSFAHFRAIQLLESLPASERIADLFGAFHSIVMQVDRRRYRSVTEIVAYKPRRRVATFDTWDRSCWFVVRAI
jgi:hypothetical protein